MRQESMARDCTANAAKGKLCTPGGRKLIGKGGFQKLNIAGGYQNKKKSNVTIG